jgi:hypothetical protein
LAIALANVKLRMREDVCIFLEDRMGNVEACGLRDGQKEGGALKALWLKYG